MAVSGDLSGLHIAACTGLGLNALLGAGGLGNGDSVGVTLSCNFGILVGMAACTGVGGVTSLGAGRSSHNISVGVALSCNFVSLVGVTTCAGVGGVASLGAGGSGHNRGVGVAGSLDNLGIGVAAGAGVNNRAIHGAGCIGGNAGVGVAGSSNFVSLVGVATCTSVGGVASLGAGGSGHNSSVGVASSLDNLGVGVAAGAGVDNRAVHGAGCIGGNAGVGVAGSSNFVTNIGIATGSASIGGVATLGAGGSGHNSSILVVGADNNFQLSNGSMDSLAVCVIEVALQSQSALDSLGRGGLQNGELCSEHNASGDLGLVAIHVQPVALNLAISSTVRSGNLVVSQELVVIAGSNGLVNIGQDGLVVGQDVLETGDAIGLRNGSIQSNSDGDNIASFIDILVNGDGSSGAFGSGSNDAQSKHHDQNKSQSNDLFHICTPFHGVGCVATPHGL